MWKGGYERDRDTMRDLMVSKVKVKKVRDTQVQKVMNSPDFR